MTLKPTQELEALGQNDDDITKAREVKPRIQRWVLIMNTEFLFCP